MRRFLVVGLGAALTVSALLAFPRSLSAHHAVSPFYDLTKTVEFEGVVSRWVFKNPHSLLYVMVTDEKGNKTEWEIELGAPINLVKRGWTPENVKVGDRIKAKGAPSRAPGSFGLSSMAGGVVTRADGSRYLEAPEPAGRGGRGATQ